MSSTEPTHGGTVSDPSQTVAAGKGKGKAADTPQDVSMGEDDSSSDEETGAEDESKEEPEEEDEDNMEEIDTDNIINDGRRTRGKTIDFAKAAENAGDELDDDDDEEDDDFEEKDEDDHEMKG
ncbi:Histone H2A.Z-specific chaperone [Imshaugia aleurites]|uniref:Histone H2A.Z-specific chaperone n=1 Tax=Imshaugia aleurites TaxID=172621 RepID=A0A8H3G6F7_9LECA|nr:Histone H2A.Z-specific chaperone [Imshaugia aleurites]